MSDLWWILSPVVFPGTMLRFRKDVPVAAGSVTLRMILDVVHRSFQLLSIIIGYMNATNLRRRYKA